MSPFNIPQVKSILVMLFKKFWSFDWVHLLEQSQMIYWDVIKLAFPKAPLIADLYVDSWSLPVRKHGRHRGNVKTHIHTEAEIGVTCLQAKALWGEAWERFFLRAFRENQLCSRLRTCGFQSWENKVVLSYWICGNLLQQPYKTETSGSILKLPGILWCSIKACGAVWGCEYSLERTRISFCGE